jgi:fructose-specific phosphotransferase system IIC component
MRAETIKTMGYLVSCVSVGLLGFGAYPGAEKAGLVPALVAGMAASMAGMGLRWLSYELEKRRKKA